MKKIYCVILSVLILLTSSLIVLSATVTAINGDANADEKINSEDALLILKCSVGSELPSYFDYDLADITGDDIINSADALMVLQIAVGKFEPSTVTREDSTITYPTITYPTITIPSITDPSKTTPSTEEYSTTTIPHSENYHGHVYTGGSGSKKYHYEAECAGKYSHEITWEEVAKRGLGPCGTCVLK